MLQEHGVCGPQFGDFVQAAGDEVARRFAEGVGWEVWGGAVDDGLCPILLVDIQGVELLSRGFWTYRQLREDIIVSFRRVRVATHRALDDGQPQRPDIALHAVCPPACSGARLCHAAGGDAFRRHVRLTTDVRLRDRRYEVPRDAEVADFYLAFGVDEDVCGFDVAVDDVVFFFQGFEAEDGVEGDFSQDAFGDAVAVDPVDGAAVHEFHADVDGAFLEEGAEEVDDVWREAAMEDVEFHDDGGEFGVVEFQSDLLHGHDDAGAASRGRGGEVAVCACGGGRGVVLVRQWSSCFVPC